MLPALVTSVRPPRFGDQRRLRHAVVRVAAEDGVDAGDARRELQVDVHAVVRQQHHGLRALAAGLVDDLLHLLFLDAERPLGDEVARVRDRRVGKRLADDRHLHAVDGADDVRLEHRVAEIGGLHVLRDEVDLAGEILLDDLLDPVRAVGELPVAGHHVDAQQLAGVDHVLAFRPQRRRRPLPGVAAVEQQRARPRRPELPDQRREVREAAGLAVGARGFLEVEIGERVRLARSRRDAEMLQQRLADQVRRLALGGAEAEVDVRLAEVHRQQLRVAVGEVQQARVAERLDAVVELRAQLEVEGVGAADGKPGHRGGGDPVQEITTVH